MRQLLKFGVVGVCATALHYIIFGAGMMLLGFSPTLATAIGYLGGSILSYVMNYKFTFSSKAEHRYAIPSFYIMVIAGWTLNTAIVYAGTGPLLLPPWPVQIAATGIVFLFNFWISRHWVFRA